MFKIFRKISALLRRGKPRFKLKEEHRVVFAFEIGGINYYEFDDAMNIPCDRAFRAMAYYDELAMRCTREFLIAHTTAMDELLNDAKNIRLSEVLKLNMQLKERLELILDHEIVYKLASVIYFDETESPYSYDYAYGMRKIAAWKKHKLSDFFFLQPIKKFLPTTDLSETDLQIYMQVSDAMTSQQLAHLFSILSDKDKTSDWYQILRSQMQSVSPSMN